jgi:transposase
MMGWTAPDGIMSAKLEVSIRSSTKGPSMTKVSMIGLDLGKNAFQVHAIDARGNVVVRKQLRRGQIEKFFAGLEPVIVGMEACGGAHHWGRMLSKLGHEVRMMPPAYVKAYRKRNKTDGRDAEAICDAMDRPTMRFIAVKSPESQAIAVLHSTRRLLVRQRTMSANGLRSALAEFGIVAAQGLKGLQALMQLLGDPATEIPDNARLSLQLLAQQWEVQNAQICKLDAEIVRAAKSDAQARRLMQIPGVGPIGATAIAAIVPDARVFKSARDFAAWLGFTPRQFGTGGKQRSGSISKQGNRTLRTLLILGATAYLRHERTHPRDPWLQALLVRRPVKVVAVALAAKIARIIWAMLVSGENYRPRRHAVAAQAA